MLDQIKKLQDENAKLRQQPKKATLKSQCTATERELNQEIRFKDNLIQPLTDKINRLNEELKMLVGILRTPLLYEKFRQSELKHKEQQQLLQSKFKTSQI